MPVIVNDQEYLDLHEAAEYLGCHTMTLIRKAQKDQIPAFKRLNKWLFRKADLAALFIPNGAVKV